MIILVSIIVLLIIGVTSETKYSNRVQLKKNVSNIKEIAVKRNNLQEGINNNNDIDEEFIEETKQNEKEEIKEDVVVNQENNVQEHHEAKQEIIVTPIISQLDQIKEKNDNLGTAGRLYIPNVNINVGLNDANIYDDENYNAQEIVDRTDSAAYYTFASKLTIADHNFQGFNRIANINSIDKAFIKSYSGSIDEYQMTNKFIGKNIGTDLIDLYGNSVENMQGDLIIYTCYGEGNQVIITLWNKLN